MNLSLSLTYTSHKQHYHCGSHPIQTVDIDFACFFVSCSQEHGSSYEQDVCYSVLIHIHHAHLTAKIWANLQRENKDVKQSEGSHTFYPMCFHWGNKLYIWCYDWYILDWFYNESFKLICECIWMIQWKEPTQNNKSFRKRIMQAGFTIQKL